MTARYMYWQDEAFWLGYLEDYPENMIQGESLEDLQVQLRSLHKYLTSGEIPGIRKVGELSLAS